MMVTKTWNAGNANWSTAADWTPSGVPGTGDAVFIKTGNPVVDQHTGTFTAGSLSIGSQGSLWVSDHSGEIHGRLTLSPNGNLELDNISNQLGGSQLKIDAGIANLGYINVGNKDPTANTTLTTTTLTNTDLHGTFGTINVSGGSGIGATIDVTNQKAGFGSLGQLQGNIGLFNTASIVFTQGGQISTIAGGSSLRIVGTGAYLVSGSATGSNSALTGLSKVVGSLSVEDGASVTATGAVSNTGTIGVDASANGEGGARFTVGAGLNNLGTVNIGNANLMGATTVTVKTLANTDNHGRFGTINIGGSTANSFQAQLIVTSGTAGFGGTTAGQLEGNVSLFDDALIDFKGGGQITRIAGGSSLRLEGVNTFVASGAATNSNSALTGLTTVTGSLSVENGAVVRTAGGLTNTGTIGLDAMANGEGGGKLTIGGKLINLGTVNIGDAQLTGATTLTVDTLANASSTGTLGTINIGGSTFNDWQAKLIVTMGTAGIGATAAGQIQGNVSLFDDALIDFKGGGQITAIAKNSSLRLEGTNVFVASGTATGSNSALTGLRTVTGSLSVENGAVVRTAGGLTNTGTVGLDAMANGEGGGKLTIGGKLTNAGMINIGNAQLAGGTVLTVDTLANASSPGTLGTINIAGSTFNDWQGKLIVTTGAAGIGTAAAGQIQGNVSLFDDALIDFRGGGQITAIVAGSSLRLVGVNAFVASGTATGSNSALTGLKTVTGALSIENGATVKVTGTLTNTGTIGLDAMANGEGGASLTVSATLNNAGTLNIGDAGLTSATRVTAAALNNAGSIQLSGSTENHASLIVGGAIGGRDGRIQLDSNADVTTVGTITGQTLAYNGTADSVTVGDGLHSAFDVTGFTDGDDLDLRGETVKSLSYGNSTLTLRLAGGAVQTFGFTGNFTGLSAVADGHGGTRIVTTAATDFTLTSGADAPTLNGTYDVVQATASTLNAGDRLVGGGGTDILALTGGGSFNLAALKAFSGFEGITTDDAGSTILLRAGSPLTVDGGNGDDTLIGTPASFTAASRFDGGGGQDTLRLGGNYAGGLTFGAATLADVETIALGTGFSYTLATDDATVAGGAKLTVDGSALKAANKLAFDGSAETDGSFAITGGAGSDTLRGGAKGDRIIGGAGADTVTGGAGYDALTGGAGADTFVYHAGWGQDTITDFTAGNAVGHDVAQFDHALFANFAAVLSHMTNNGSDAVLKLSATETVTFDNLHKADFVASDFKFV